MGQLQTECLSASRSYLLFTLIIHSRRLIHAETTLSLLSFPLDIKHEHCSKYCQILKKPYYFLWFCCTTKVITQEHGTQNWAKGTFVLFTCFPSSCQSSDKLAKLSLGLEIEFPITMQILPNYHPFPTGLSSWNLCKEQNLIFHCWFAVYYLCFFLGHC